MRRFAGALVATLAVVGALVGWSCALAAPAPLTVCPSGCDYPVIAVAISSATSTAAEEPRA